MNIMLSVTKICYKILHQYFIVWNLVEFFEKRKKRISKTTYLLCKYFSSNPPNEHGCWRIHASTPINAWNSLNCLVFVIRKKINGHGCVVAKNLLVKLGYIRGKLFLCPFLLYFFSCSFFSLLFIPSF